MKVVIRTFAICVVLAGAAAATLFPASRFGVSSHQSATSKLPIPVCGPDIPTCGPNASQSIR